LHSLKANVQNESSIENSHSSLLSLALDLSLCLFGKRLVYIFTDRKTNKIKFICFSTAQTSTCCTRTLFTFSDFEHYYYILLCFLLADNDSYLELLISSYSIRFYMCPKTKFTKICSHCSQNICIFLILFSDWYSHWLFLGNKILFPLISTDSN
jgi:hypothetical protein